jgi:hypothetical protein
VSSQQPPASGEGAGPADPSGRDQPSEEELRAAYEAELERITTGEVIMQTAVSLLNLGARRLRPAESGPGAGGRRDLEQVRDAIDGVRGLMGVLERRYPRELAPLREALSQLQLAYARDAQASPAPEGAASAPTGGAAGAPSQSEPQPSEPKEGEDEAGRGPGPAESSGRLWVPGR